MIEYKRIKDFKAQQIQELFMSVKWYSGNFSEKLRIVLHNSSRVISAWDEEKLANSSLRSLDLTMSQLIVNQIYIAWARRY